jgi:4'-phosphopantetheinyl transferase
VDAVALAWSRLAPLAAAHGAHAESWLSQAEQHKLARMRSPERRAQFVAGRWLLRELLARCHGGTPQDWQLSAPEHGPPTVLAPVKVPLHLALSHSSDLVAGAISAEPVGVDVECPQRQRDVTGLAALCCDVREQAQLQSLPADQREALFYALWTAKEAWLKRHGEDLAPRRLAQIHLAAASSETEAQVRVWRGKGWTLALATPAGVSVRWHGPQPGLLCVWQVQDDALRPA